MYLITKHTEESHIVNIFQSLSGEQNKTVIILVSLYTQKVFLD